MDGKKEQFLETRKQCDSFFREALDDAVKRQKVQISDEVAFYLLSILLLGLRKDPHLNSGATIERYIAALSGEGPESFKNIGDVSLMVAGIWWESLARKLVGVDYYVKIGQLSYQREAESNRRLSWLFKELSDNFLKSVNILTEATQFISREEKHLTSVDILTLYKRWLETHNVFLEKKLRSLGINPVDIKRTK